jgi:hypothetical protein
MSILIWVRDKLFGSPKVETPVNPQITDAVTQTAPVVPAETTPVSAPKRAKKSTASKAKKVK